MKVSYQWLSEYVDLKGYTASDLAEKLTRSGIEVDTVENRNKGVTNVVVGYVKTREKHPDADKLSVCTVDAGQGELLQIVCGAKNVDAGQKVPVALVGAELPGGLQIKRAKLRGVESMGMICSAKELGLNEKLLPKEQQEGILVLPEDTQVGASILEVLGIGDEVMELDLTPNRSDCLSMIGVAYEIAAILGRDVLLPEDEVGLHPSQTKTSDQLHVDITAAEQCSRYSARIISGVKVGPSPLWLQSRLTAAGVRPINNIVDVTNYVMLEYGQPLHAFDAAKLEGGRIEVRLAREGEKFVTLDNVERTLAPHMLLIADGVKPIALAGVMGGANSEVSAETTTIVLESAKFDGGTVRKASRQLGLRSEASLRFEKEVNADAVIPALDRAASLIAKLAGGGISEGIAESVTHHAEPVTVRISLDKINRYLGTELSSLEIKVILNRLHFQYEDKSNGEWHIHVPLRRGDITRDVDVIEEIARLYGYDNIPVTPILGATTPGSLTREQSIRRTLRRLLTESGLHEVVTYSFTHPEQIAAFRGMYPSAKPIALSMPMSEERSVLRTSLVPHLLDTALYNRNRNMDDVAVFEIGKVFVTSEDALTTLPQEKLMLGVVWTGKRSSAHWGGKAEKVDFYDLKGVFEKLTSALGIEEVRYSSAQPEGFHPGRTAEIAIGSGTIGRLGQLHPALQQTKDLEDTYVLEIELEPLIEHASFRIEYKPLPKYPSIGRDMAIVVDAGVPVGEIRSTARNTAGALLESIEVFDIYTGERLGGGKKSVAFALVYRHPDRTLTDEEVAELHGKVVTALEQTFGAELRK
ncbi:phenylalanine--tRNA ligase subunit beta [Paenibacillus mesophilus]|uniref:phenylalanine--tRNA ligase subunit beta n=1 Tax=Paenibacillus mesophilus TaxID=2582849 RepID=UPI00110D2E19|nr:phenylalanine--tRNA ligase subunit beta [Paenibacillus mesophilus]TMV42687.1 phenylalanine--tRNA ligase subunit beta [Paenibacillus mesophilus]